MQDIKWGIIGCGGIAHEFATSLQALETGTLLAGASRTPGRAQEFAEKHGMECIEARKLESDILPLSTTLAIMQTMDTLRSQWRLKYEGE